MIDLSLSDEQREIVESISTLLRDNSPVARLRPSGTRDDVHGQLAAWGWFGVGLAEQEGGLGLGIAEETLLYLEAGRSLLSPSVLATTLAVGLADVELRARLVAGGSRAALAMPAGQGATYCFDRGDAAALVMIDGDETTLHPADAFTGAELAGLDENVVLEKGMLDVSRRLATAPADRATLLTAAMLVGVAKAAGELAVDYAKVREQFGQPIGGFQAVKHHCVNMALDAFFAEAQLLMAAACAAAGAADAAFQRIVAARTAIKASRSNAAVAIQIHGGMGFTAECDAHLFLKRAHLLGRVIGGLEAQDARLLACPAPEGQ